jgi:hypothetical protein
LLVAGFWLLVAGCWLLVAGCWLLVAGLNQRYGFVGSVQSSRFQVQIVIDYQGFIDFETQLIEQSHGYY